MVHRKGATRAEAGTRGIVPGSQGSPSYIVEGLGNPDSFRSCAHGAGRRMGRNEAIKRLDFAAEKAKLEAQGILHSLNRPRDLEEAMSAYKDISEVMKAQADLVAIRHELKPLAVVKG
jgi:tRNA-splicing ligase RtcB